MAKASSDIRSLARAHTATAIKTLAGIMMQSKAPAAARVAAATALLDRGWGKPQASVDMTVRNAVARELSDDELAAIIAEGSSGGTDIEAEDAALPH